MKDKKLVCKKCQEENHLYVEDGPPFKIFNTNQIGMMKCLKCNERVNRDMDFCDKCFKEVKNENPQMFE